MSEFIIETEEFNIRKVMDSDYEAFGEIAAAEYLFGEHEFEISGIQNKTEKIIKLRAMLISYYADKKDKKIIIGNFRQRPQPMYEHAIEFSNSLDMIFGIETIYCVKDKDIITNIRQGGKENGKDDD